jgi:dihydropteroate synthase
MGILNVTPDSFSDGGKFQSVENALEQAERMIADGADILDIGGESTRPATFQCGASISIDEELRRVIPIIAHISRRFPGTPLSIDTYKAVVANAAVDAGAVLINDISAMRADPDMAHTMAETGAAVCLMHLLGLPGRIEVRPMYVDVVREVRDHLKERALAAEMAGILRERIVLDPGIGFGKTTQHNLELLRRQRELVFTEYPLLIGTSRKSTIGVVLDGAPPSDRLEGTAATIALAIANGAAIVRVHDVKEMRRVARMTDAIVRG